MLLLIRVFNSVIFLFVNLGVMLYTFHKFFLVMKVHYKLMAEATEFGALVHQSRSSLEYVSGKVKDAMKEIETDIGKEVHITHNLTKISSKVSQMAKRLEAVEEEVIELARTNRNMESRKVETPSDINEEVKKVLRKKSTIDPPKSPKKLRPTTDVNDSDMEKDISSKFPTGPFLSNITASRPQTPRRSNSVIKPRSPSPEVQLIDNNIHRKPFGDKPTIGFRTCLKVE